MDVEGGVWRCVLYFPSNLRISNSKADKTVTEVLSLSKGMLATASAIENIAIARDESVGPFL